jgi:hypothetical protein
MFGNFLDQFGLNFQLPDANAQGGLFGPDAQQPAQQPPGAPPAPGGAGTGLNMTQPVTGAAQAPPGVTAPGGGNNVQPVTGPQQQPPQPSPLASPLAPGGGSSFGQPQNQQPDPAPAAGVGSQFGNNGKTGF